MAAQGQAPGREGSLTMPVLLEAQAVCKYFGGLKAVEKVDMQVMEGDIHGIIGPNGAGKTTFFNICSGVHKPTSGTIAFQGEDITRLTPEAIARRGMARTFQNIKLFKYMTVLENVKVGFHIRTRTGIASAIFRNACYREDEKFIERKGMEILERVGLAEVGEGCWGVYFGRQLLGIVDEPARKVVDAGEAVRKGRVSESALRSPFRYAPGAPEGAPNM